MKLRRTGRFWLVIIGVISLLLILMANWVSPVWYKAYELDRDTGRVRYTRMCFYLPVHSWIESTVVSQVLGFDDLENPAGDWCMAWRGTNVGANNECIRLYDVVRSLETLYKVQQFTPEVQAEVAKTVLIFGKREYGGRMAFDFLDGLFKVSGRKESLTDPEDVVELRSQVLSRWEIKAN